MYAPFRTLDLPTDNAAAFRNHTAIQPRLRYTPPGVDTGDVIAIYYPKYRLTAAPDIAAQYDTSLFYRAAFGVSFETLRTRKFYTRTSVTGGWSTREGINQTHTLTGPLHQRDEFLYLDVRSRTGYTPNRYLNVSAGIDNQFFGEGYRSLIQSDQVAPNPFAMMRVNIWRLEYGLLYQFFHEQDSASRLWKFGATHYLSWNVTKNWNMAFFETVLFQPTDGSFNRGFEVEYLNPIVFFRPQEYSIGSSDNVLLGFNTSYRLKNHTVYGQLLLDEFLLSEIRARSRWWANKYGAQLGVKGRFGKLTYRVEGNLVRPYTYAHLNDGQNGGNRGLPLAHPLGSNFAELLVQAQYPVKEVFSLRAYANFFLKGYDQDTLSWGGNIYESYVNRPLEYGNTIGQGVTMRTVRVGCELNFSLRKMLRIFSESHLYVDPQIAFGWGDLPSKVTPAVTVGWRNEVFGERRNF
jgi:hypothetical protein